jgi:hypothetical protein
LPRPMATSRNSAMLTPIPKTAIRALIAVCSAPPLAPPAILYAPAPYGLDGAQFSGGSDDCGCEEDYGLNNKTHRDLLLIS